MVGVTPEFRKMLEGVTNWRQISLEELSLENPGDAEALYQRLYMDLLETCVGQGVDVPGEVNFCAFRGSAEGWEYLGGRMGLGDPFVFGGQMSSGGTTAYWYHGQPTAEHAKLCCEVAQQYLEG